MESSAFSLALTDAASAVLDALRSRRFTLATAESCTGGLLAGVFTEVAGASDAYAYGFVTYSDEAKKDVLSVPANLLRDHGAVSAEVAHAMAGGALRVSSADIAVAVTGIAGPGGGSEEKPVGLVYVAIAQRNGSELIRECRFGNLGRSAIRLMSVQRALDLTLEALGSRVPNQGGS